VKPLHDPRRSDPTTDANLALERLFELAVLLADGMERGLAERGLSRARAEILWRLGRAGPTTQRDLSRALACTPRNITGLVDALEAGGQVARRPHPSDRRATLVTLTAKGDREAALMQADYRKLARSLFGDFEPVLLKRFAGDIDRILGRLRRDASGPGESPQAG
jgi:DNA-binding MarR family transcriptional regulator